MEKNDVPESIKNYPIIFFGKGRNKFFDQEGVFELKQDDITIDIPKWYHFE